MNRMGVTNPVNLKDETNEEQQKKRQRKKVK